MIRLKLQPVPFGHKQMKSANVSKEATSGKKVLNSFEPHGSQYSGQKEQTGPKMPRLQHHQSELHYMALIVTAPSRNTHVTGSFRAADVLICGWKFHSCELIDSTGVKWCARPSPVTTDFTLYMYRFSSVHEKVQFFPRLRNSGLRQWIINRLASKLSFPHTIQLWQSENDSLCDTTTYFWKFRHELDINAGLCHAWSSWARRD